jgi:c-di-AMP phosphodiesterase-like protein
MTHRAVSDLNASAVDRFTLNVAIDHHRRARDDRQRRGLAARMGDP